MAFISELTGRPVTDFDGTKIGVLRDLVARSRKEFHHPVIDAVVIQRKRDQVTIPYSDLAALLSVAIPLKRPLGEIHPYTPQEEDLLLVKDVLDKQIIDIDGARVVRVNDIELIRVNGNIVVSNVDVGTLGILRRIGLEKIGRWLASRFKVDTSQGQISWEFVEPLVHDQSMRLKVPVEKLAELHPSDIADIISDLNRVQTGQLLDKLDLEQLADTLEEVEPDFQASLLHHMPDEKIADVLEEMSPDEAADLLAELPQERTKKLLSLMENGEAEEVRKLLTYPEDTAGGLMTTEFAAVRPNLTASQTIKQLRMIGEEIELLYYVYVTDESGRLIGDFSLPDLIMALPGTQVSEFMNKRVVSVHLTDEQDEIAQVVAKYNLRAVPVVDDNECLHGIVTADDALDKIIPTSWKKRLPRFFGGLK